MQAPVVQSFQRLGKLPFFFADEPLRNMDAEACVDTDQV